MHGSGVRQLVAGNPDSRVRQSLATTMLFLFVLICFIGSFVRLVSGVVLGCARKTPNTTLPPES